MDMDKYQKSLTGMTDAELEEELRHLREERFRPATAEKTVKKQVRKKKELKVELHDMTQDELMAQLELIKASKQGGDNGEDS